MVVWLTYCCNFAPRTQHHILTNNTNNKKNISYEKKGKKDCNDDNGHRSADSGSTG